MTIDLSDAYFHIDIYPSQEIPLICIPRHSIRVSNSCLWASFSSEDFYQVCGSLPVSFEKRGNKDIVIHRRLSDMLVVERASWERRGDGAESSQQLGVQDQHDKEPLAALTTDRIFGAQHRLPLQCQTDRGESRVFYTMHARFQMGKVVPFRLCLRMLSLMALVISVVHLGLLNMRDFQR